MIYLITEFLKVFIPKNTWYKLIFLDDPRPQRNPDYVMKKTPGKTSNDDLSVLFPDIQLNCDVFRMEISYFSIFRNLRWKMLHSAWVTFEMSGRETRIPNEFQSQWNASGDYNGHE